MTTRFLVAAAATMFVSACGEATPVAGEARATEPSVAAAPATKQVSACDILTPADAERALGMKVVRQGDPGAGSVVQTCSYAADTQDVFKLQNQVSVSLTPYTVDQLMPEAERARMKSEPIAGLGDAALYTDGPGLMVTKGKTTATYLMMGNGYDKKAILTELAKATVDRF